MANLYDKAGLVNIPVGYQDGFLYNIKPEDNTLGFRFNRDSAATRVNKEGLIEQVGYFGPELVQNGNFSELGPELVTNGDFATDSDWTKGAGWSISGGSANCDGTQTSQTTLESTVLALGVGNLFKITFDISNYSSGQIDLITLVGTGGPEITNINANGSYTAYSFGPSGSDNRIQIIANSDFIGSIDNVSVKQVDPNDYWNLGTGWSFGDDKAVFTSGTSGILFQSNIVETGKLYKLTFDVIRTSGFITSVFLGGVSNNTDINESGSYIYYITSINQDVLGFNADSTFNGSITNISVTEVLGDKPRIDYTDSLTSPSFLLEPQSTNLVTFSEDLTGGSLKFATATANTNETRDPGGKNNATKFEVTQSGSDSYVRTGYTAAVTDFSCFIYLKGKKGQKFQFFAARDNYAELNPGVSGVCTGEWQKVSFSGTFSTTSSTVIIGLEFGQSTDDSVKGQVYYAWGCQLEALSYPTSYIPTAGSTVTRAQETCNGAGNASTFNSTEGVLYAEIAALADDGITRRFSISDGTNNNRVLIGFSSSNRFQFVVSDGGSVVVNQLITVSDITQFNKVAISYKLNDCAIWINGQKVGTDTSATMPSGLNTLNFNQGSATESLYGKVKGVYVFNEALTDDELQQLTGPEYNSFAALAAAYNYTVI